jgi:AraC-like DNA-binding protein
VTDAIKVISNDGGFKDTAYFCRRFKMMFGVQAGKMKKRLNEI